MAGPIALVGGDEFRPGCEEMDLAILETTGVKGPRVLILPTAAANQDPRKAATNGAAYFSGLGARSSALMVLGPAEAGDEHLMSPLDSADLVYITGGDPGHLLETLTGSLLLKRLEGALERGAVLAGSSAGAMVLGSWMRFRGWAEALRVVDDIAVLAHHEGAFPESVSTELAASSPAGVSVLGIDAMTCCFGRPGRWRVLGSGAVTLYFQGRWQRYSSGDKLPV